MNLFQTAPSVAGDVEETQALMYCDTCHHLRDRHDAIDLRYCAATLKMALTRRCICREEKVEFLPPVPPAPAATA